MISDKNTVSEISISGEQAKEQEMKDMLKKQGFNTEGMNFGGGFGGRTSYSLLLFLFITLKPRVA